MEDEAAGMDIDESPESMEEQDASEWRSLIQDQNRKNKKSGGFQAMGLSPSVFRGVMKKGYKVPTPIQRKSIPVIMDGKDVVAMARTGSGKTAAFLIPLLEKLKIHAPEKSPRALVLSPTRELALQTFRFTRELARFTNLNTTIVLGGDRMEDQFQAMHMKPDIIIATPGRLLHVLVEMNLQLNFIEYCVFDEADRLFEMGFGDQLKEIINRMPAARQTLMFSATLPKSMVEFAKAGLSEPTLLRLDVDTKLSENLQMSFLACREIDKPAILCSLLRKILKPYELTVVFAATKHHVEYLKDLLLQAGISCTCIYSSLDPSARKINLEKFRRHRCQVMIVTDIAARGVDIPDLDNVINYHFPPKAKLFVHRVGRVARAGRSGHAYSLIAGDELAYLIDLHLFLGRPVIPATDFSIDPSTNGVYGAVPQLAVDEEEDMIRSQLMLSDEMQSMRKVCDNGYMKYLQTRPAAAHESVSRVKKEFRDLKLAAHPIFRDHSSDTDIERKRILDSLRGYKAHSTIFELGGNNKSDAFKAMKAKRKLHEKTIEKTKRYQISQEADKPQMIATSSSVDIEDAEEAEGVFSTVVESRPSSKPFIKKKRKEPKFIPQPFVPYAPANFHSEKGLELEHPGFQREAQGSMMELHTDEADQMLKNKRQTKWDRKRKKYVQADTNDPKKKKIRTESGAWIPATYKSDLYEQWKKAHQIDHFENKGHESDDEPAGASRSIHDVNKGMGAGRMKYQKSQNLERQTAQYKRRKFKAGAGQRELLSKDQIARARGKKADLMSRQKGREKINSKKRDEKKGASRK